MTRHIYIYYIIFSEQDKDFFCTKAIRNLAILCFYDIMTELVYFLTICRRIEVVITGLTRNQFAGQPARGFESRRLRSLKIPSKRRKTVFTGDFDIKILFLI